MGWLFPKAEAVWAAARAETKEQLEVLALFKDNYFTKNPKPSRRIVEWVADRKTVFQDRLRDLTTKVSLALFARPFTPHTVPNLHLSRRSWRAVVGWFGTGSTLE